MERRPIRIEAAWVDDPDLIVGSVILAPDDPAYAEELAACLEEERLSGVPIPFVEDSPEPYSPAPVRYEPGSPSWYEYVRHLHVERGLDLLTIQRWCPGVTRAEIERAVQGEQ